MRKHLITICLLTLTVALAWGRDYNTFDEMEYTVANSAAHPTSYQSEKEENNTVNIEATQKKKNKFWTKDKLLYGGNIGLRVDKNYFDVLIMPEVGYQLFKPWRFSLAPKYQYSGNMPHGEYQGSQCHTAGIQVSTAVDFVRMKKNTPRETGIFLFAAYLYEHEWASTTTTNPNESVWGETDSNYFDVGIGIRQRVGMRSSFNIMATWHFYDSNFQNNGRDGWFAEGYPTISVGFTY